MYRNGSLEYIKVFDKYGLCYMSSLPIKIEPIEKREKYHLSESHKIRIELTYSDNSECGMLILFGNVNSDGQLVDTLDNKLSISNVLKYEIIPKNIGLNKVEGILSEIMWIDSLGEKDYYNHKYFRVTAQDYFKYEFFVEGADI